MNKLFKRLFALLVLCGFMWVMRAYGARATAGWSQLAVALGFLLLSAYLGGQVAKAAGLSRITGYIVVGLLVGPGAVGLLTEADVGSLAFLNDVALGLIALTAGGELDLKKLRGMGRSLVSITLVQSVVVFVAVAGAVLALHAWLPFTAGRPTALVLTVAMVFGSIAIASSPSVAIAVITDSRSEGPVTTTVLGVTVMKDVLVIVAFAVALSVAFSVLEPDAAGGEGSLALTLAWEIGGSIAVGALLGLGVAAYLKWAGLHMVLFTIGLAWLSAELAALLHLEVLLLGLTAGFTLENLLPVEGHEFVESLEQASLPVYALFFGLAGAGVHLDALGELWHWALLLIGVRAAALWSGTDLGARLGGAGDVVRKRAWLGYVSQAGVALGMVTILARSFPGWGAELKTLFVAMVAVHELVGPILLDRLLASVGEAGRARSKGAPEGAGTSEAGATSTAAGT